MTGNQAADSARRSESRTARVLTALPRVSLLGFVALAVNGLLSFEEPHPEMLLASGLLLLSTPLGVALHLNFTHELTRTEKRAWVAGLTGRRGMAYLSAYLEGGDRRRALEQLASGRAQA